MRERASRKTKTLEEHKPRSHKTNQKGTLKIMHINVQCLSNKINALEILAHQLDVDILCVCEHWLGQNFSIYTIEGYRTISTYCRTRYSHGGVCIYAKGNLDLKEDTFFKNTCIEKECEIVGAYSQSRNLIIVECYRTPNGNFNVFLEQIEKTLEYMQRNFNPQTKIVLAGDYNIDFLKQSRQGSSLSNLFGCYDLVQTINNVTRQTSGTCLDNIFTNIDADEYRAEAYAACLSDHDALVFVYSNVDKNAFQEAPLGIRHFSEIRINRFHCSLSAEMWETVFSVGDANEKYNNFLDTFLFHFNEAFPWKTRHFHNKHKPLTPELKQIKETLSLLYNIFAQTKDETSRRIYINYKSFYNRCCEMAKVQKNKYKIATAENKQKALWDTINKETGRQKNKTKINNVYMPSPETLNDFFISVAEKITENQEQKPSSNADYTKTMKVNGSTMFFFPTTTYEVHKYIQNLKNKTTKDYYGIDTRLVKRVAPSILEPLTNIINTCLVQGIFPDRMKIAKVTPIHKKGDIQDPSNYRPISVLPVFSKILEAKIKTCMLKFMEKNEYLTPCQFGFRKNLNTTDAILSMVNFISTAFEERDHCMALLCDLTKAFDCMSHDLLLKKLAHYGFRGGALQLLRSYLTNRKQIVSSNQKVSQMKTIPNGIAQGSIIGPLLFIIYINDLPSAVKCYSMLYADDTTLVLRSRDTDLLRENMEEVRAEAERWFSANKLTLNTDKTTEMSFTSSKLRRDLHGGTGRILGVTMDTMMTWHPHIKKLASESAQTIYAIRRASQMIGKGEARIAYFALFLAKISYGLEIWGGSAHMGVAFVMQKKAVRAIGCSPFDAPCRPLFREYKLMTLPSLYLYLVLKRTRNSITNMQTRASTHNHDTRRKKELDIPFARLNTTASLKDGMRAFNKLPEEWKSLPNGKFTRKIRDFLTTAVFYSKKEFFSHIFT